LNFTYTCYSIINGEYDYSLAANYTLTLDDGTVLKSSSTPIPPTTIEKYKNNISNITFGPSDNLAQYCHKNETTTFILTMTVPNNDDITSRSVRVSVTAVDLALTSTFNDL